MAASTSHAAEAFEDSFTKSHGGQCYFVSVEPIFEEQITEAVTLIARSRPENVRVSYISQFAAAAKQAAPVPEPKQRAEGEEEQDEQDDEEEEDKKEVEETEEQREAKRKVIRDLLSSIKGLRLEGTDKEFEGFANLLLSLILSLFAATHPDFPQLILILSDALAFTSSTSAVTSSANPSLSSRYASLAILFNSLPSTVSNLRLTVLLKLITFAAAHDDFSVIAPALARLESWLLEWGFGPGTPGEEEGNAAVSTVVGALIAKSKLAEARSILLAHLSSPSAVQGTSSSPSASGAKLASQLITLSLALPSVYDFSALSAIPAVASPSTPALAELLAIFQQGDVAAFEKFVGGNKSVLDEQKLEQQQLETKLKLLALAELCSKKVGETVTYDEIAEALRLQAGADDDGEEVETWVIDAIRASLISGRLSQSLASFHVTRAAPRSFTSAHWTQLASRLEGWRSSLDAILDSVAKGVNVGESHGGAVELAGQGQGQKEQAHKEEIAA